MKILHRFFFILVCLIPVLLVAEIEVKDVQGRDMKIEVLAYTPSSNNVRIKRISDGAMFNLKLDVFDSESQQKIKAAAPAAKADLHASVSVGRRRQDVAGSSYMERQTITAKAIVKNDSRDIDFASGKGTVLLVARQTRRFSDRSSDYGKILHREDFDLTVHPGKTFEFNCKPMTTEYDSDKDKTNIGGWEYYGWVLILQDKAGIHSVTTNIGNLKKDVAEKPGLGEVFLKLSIDQLVETDLKEK